MRTEELVDICIDKMTVLGYEFYAPILGMDESLNTHYYIAYKGAQKCVVSIRCTLLPVALSYVSALVSLVKIKKCDMGVLVTNSKLSSFATNLAEEQGIQVIQDILGNADRYLLKNDEDVNEAISFFEKALRKMTSMKKCDYDEFTNYMGIGDIEASDLINVMENMGVINKNNEIKQLSPQEIDRLMLYNKNTIAERYMPLVSGLVHYRTHTGAPEYFAALDEGIRQLIRAYIVEDETDDYEIRIRRKLCNNLMLYNASYDVMFENIVMVYTYCFDREDQESEIFNSTWRSETGAPCVITVYISIESLYLVNFNEVKITEMPEIDIACRDDLEEHNVIDHIMNYIVSPESMYFMIENLVDENGDNDNLDI